MLDPPLSGGKVALPPDTLVQLVLPSTYFRDLVWISAFSKFHVRELPTPQHAQCISNGPRSTACSQKFLFVTAS